MSRTGLKRWVPCEDYIDWSDLSMQSSTERSRRQKKALKRLANGIRKFIVNTPRPYIVKDSRAMAFLVKYHSETRSDTLRGKSLAEPVQTIDTSKRYGLVTA